MSDHLIDNLFGIDFTPPDLPRLSVFEVIDVMSKARLCLSLKVPDDDASQDQINELYEQQRMRILNFVELLHESLITDQNKVLLCLYQCE
jgi:hypothetical protein